MWKLTENVSLKISGNEQKIWMWKRTENVRKHEILMDSPFWHLKCGNQQKNGYSVDFHIFSVRFPFWWDLSLLVSWYNGFRICSLDFHRMNSAILNEKINDKQASEGHLYDLLSLTHIKFIVGKITYFISRNCHWQVLAISWRI